jgi:anti-anti-sigma factor
MPRGYVTHAEQNGVHVLRYFGRIDYMSAPAIQRFLDEMLARSGGDEWIFDLSGAEALDSTNLVLLARANSRVLRASGLKAMIISVNDDINEVLRSMGFDHLFELVTDMAPPSSARAWPIPAQAASPDELRQTMIDAHRALVQLSDAGRVQFQDVVRCLESDRSLAP